MESVLQALTGFQTPQTRAQVEWENKLMTCRECHRQSRDRKVVTTYGEHVGGDSFPRFYESCTDGKHLRK